MHKWTLSSRFTLGPFLSLHTKFQPLYPVMERSPLGMRTIVLLLKISLCGMEEGSTQNCIHYFAGADLHWPVLQDVPEKGALVPTYMGSTSTTNPAPLLGSTCYHSPTSSSPFSPPFTCFTLPPLLLLLRTYLRHPVVTGDALSPVGELAMCSTRLWDGLAFAIVVAA